jgi:hypothetical protein
MYSRPKQPCKALLTTAKQKLDQMSGGKADQKPAKTGEKKPEEKKQDNKE